MWMTLKTGLPTLNGISGWDPPGWRLRVTDMTAAYYYDAAKQWIAFSKLNEQVCLYERRQRRWSLFNND